MWQSQKTSPGWARTVVFPMATDRARRRKKGENCSSSLGTALTSTLFLIFSREKNPPSIFTSFFFPIAVDIALLLESDLSPSLEIYGCVALREGLNGDGCSEVDVEEVIAEVETGARTRGVDDDDDVEGEREAEEVGGEGERGDLSGGEVVSVSDDEESVVLRFGRNPPTSLITDDL